MESSHGCYGGLLGENQVRCLLVESYTSEFQLRNFKSCRSRQSEKRSAELPPPDRHGKISAFGSFFGLEGFDAVVRQVHRALLRLHIGVEDTSEFARSLQLLRLVAAPGLGKSTVLREVWGKLYQLACDANMGTNCVSALHRRILTSLKPGQEMVFLLDLERQDVHQLHPLERDLGAGMLALRMLYSSLCNSRRSYSTFLNSMNPCLLKSIRPLDVLYFWRQAAGIPEGTPWMAVFAVDVNGAAPPAVTTQQPSWLQVALSHFVSLRQEAASINAQDELLCMPVAITASTRASASSLRNSKSLLKDIHLCPLTDVQMRDLVFGLAKRSRHQVAIPASLPPQLVLLLQLTGGSPRLVCQTLCLLTGSSAVHSGDFLAGRPDCWKWLQGDFNIVQVVDRLCSVLQDQWNSWLGPGQFKVNLLNQLVAHCICRIPIARPNIVPGSETSGVSVSWQDMEKDGLAYIGEPDQGWQPGNSGNSPSSMDTQVQSSAADATYQPGLELGSEGLVNIDAEMHVLSMPPVLLIATYRFMGSIRNSLVWVPLLNQLTDEWRQRELTDVSILVAKLLFMHDTLQQPWVALSDLLGCVDVGEHQMLFCVPEDHFSVCDISHSLDPGSAQLEDMVSNMGTQWAFRGPDKFGPDSWLLLRRYDTSVSETFSVVLLSTKLNNHTEQECMQSEKLEQEAGGVLHIPGVDSLTVYITDQRQPRPAKSSARLAVPPSMVLVDRKNYEEFYSACVALVKSTIASTMGAKRARGGL